MRQNKKFQISVVIAGVLPVITFLLTGCGGSAGHGDSIFIEPRSVTLSPGQIQIFSGGAIELPGQPYAWRLTEGDRAGSFTDIPDAQASLSRPTAVTYTAPVIRGIYHLRVSVNQDSPSDLTAEATIQVR